MDRFLIVKNLVKRYRRPGLFGRAAAGVCAVDRVSFAMSRETVFGLVGESGCGKTSLVRSILFLDPPTSGEVWFDGTCLNTLSARRLRDFRKRMQIVFQDPNSALNPKMRIEDSLAEGLVNRGIPAPERNRRIDKLLDMVGIRPTHRRRYPHEFSGGQKQRIVIARALSMEPDFLVLDEPVSNLDVSIQAQIINLLLDLKQDLKLTYLFISHDLNLVAYVSDRIGVMYRGRLVEVASTEEIMRRARHPYTLRLFASMPGRSHVEGADAGPAAGEKKRPDVITGCAYAGDCALADERCRRREPMLREVGEDHRIACFKIEAVVPCDEDARLP